MTAPERPRCQPLCETQRGLRTLRRRLSPLCRTTFRQVEATRKNAEMCGASSSLSNTRIPFQKVCEWTWVFGYFRWQRVGCTRGPEWRLFTGRLGWSNTRTPTSVLIGQAGSLHTDPYSSSTSGHTHYVCRGNGWMACRGLWIWTTGEYEIAFRCNNYYSISFVRCSIYLEHFGLATYLPAEYLR